MSVGITIFKQNEVKDMSDKNYKEALKEVLLTEQRGRGGPPMRGGGASFCTCANRQCANYGVKVVGHQRGVPCNTLFCPLCGQPLTGLGAPGQRR